jgi:hypothetical protein
MSMPRRRASWSTFLSRPHRDRDALRASSSAFHDLPPAPGLGRVFALELLGNRFGPDVGAVRSTPQCPSGEVRAALRGAASEEPGVVRHPRNLNGVTEAICDCDGVTHSRDRGS